MVASKRKSRAGQSGSTSVADVAPSGSERVSTPTNNMGGKGGKPSGDDQHQSGLDRYRVNVSLPPAVHRALMGSAALLGTSASQAALQAILNGLPGLREQVTAAAVLGGGSNGD